MLCVYRHNNIPYRAQVVQVFDEANIEIELVDVGAFFTVPQSRLKKVYGSEMIEKPRFAIPCRIEGSSDQLKMEKALDGFDRLSTNKSISMKYIPKEDRNGKQYALIKLLTT